MYFPGFKVPPHCSAANRNAGDAPRTHLGTFDEAARRPQCLTQRHVFPQALLLTGMNTCPEHARRVVVTVDTQGFESTFHVGHRLVIEPDELRGLLHAHPFDEHIVLDAHAAQQVAGIAATGTEAGEFLFQHDHIRPERLEFQRGRQPGKAGADHDHIGLRVTFEGRLQISRSLYPSPQTAKLQRC